MNETLKKGLTITLSVMTAVWSLGVTAFAPVTAGAAGAAASEGDLIKASLASVYYYGSDGKRYVFPNQKTYNSWYAGFTGVMTLTDSELAAISIGGNATYAPGSKMLKITTDPKTYLPGAAGMLYHVTSEAVASGLFGSDWNMDVHDVPDAFFTNYKVSGSSITASEAAVNLPSEFGGLRYWDGTNLYVLGSDMQWHKVTNGMMNPNNAYVEAAKFNEYPMGADWTEAAMMDLWDPARLGSQDGGSNDGPAPEDVSVTVKTKSQELAMKAGASATVDSQNMGVATVEVCADNASVENVKVDLGAGTAFDTNVFGYWQTGSGAILKESGTEDSDRVQVYQPETNVTVNGCETWYWFNAITTNGGIAKASLKSIEFSGAAGATVVDVMAEIMGRNVVPVATTDLADFVATNPTPAAGTTLQTDGTKQKIYGMSGQVNNNDVYIPNMTFKFTGSLEVSNCELRVNGVVVSSNAQWVNGRYMTFTIDEGKRVFDEGTDLWEVWCNVNGEAGQSYTPSWTFPAPYMYIYDNVRAKAAPSPAAAAAPMDTTRELIAPNGSQLTNLDGAVDLDGASATVSNIPLTKVSEGGVKLDDEVTDETTNKVLGVWVLEVRGDDADLSQLDFLLAGTAANHGVTNCQVRIGMRNDKGEIDVSSVELNNFDLSNFGGEGTIIDTTREVISSRRLVVGDWLIVVECDINESTGTYTTNDTVQVILEGGSANVTFDIGSSADTPASDVPATAVTIRALSLDVNADTTILYLVANATNKVIGKFALVGTHEDVQVNSVAIDFDANIAGTNGCTNVTLQDNEGKTLATSQSLTGAAELTFSVLFTVPKNSQKIVRVLCTQAGSGVSNGTVAGATTLTDLSLTGLESNQSATVAANETGPQVNTEASGSITVSKGNIPADSIIAPGQQMLAFVGTVKASIEEPQQLETFAASFTEGTANVGVNELDQAMLKLEGFMIDGVAAAAETTVCTRDISGTDVSCELDGVTLAAGQTGIFRWYVTGEQVGSIGLGAPTAGDPISDDLLIDVTTTTSTATSDVVAKGVDSQVLNAPTAGATLNGRSLVPVGAGVRVVNQSAASRFEQGQLDMVMGELDLIVTGQQITWTGMTMECNGDATAGVCDDGQDTFDVRLGDNNFVVTAGAIAVGGGMDASGLTETIIPGTERITLFLNDIVGTGARCVDPEGVSFTVSAFGFTVEQIVFDPTGNDETAYIPDFTLEAGASMKLTQITCT